MLLYKIDNYKKINVNYFSYLYKNITLVKVSLCSNIMLCIKYNHGEH